MTRNAIKSATARVKSRGITTIECWVDVVKIGIELRSKA
jgi:hypothetical protein